VQPEHHGLPHSRRACGLGQQLGDGQGHRQEDRAPSGRVREEPGQRKDPRRVPGEQHRGDQHGDEAGPPHGSDHDHRSKRVRLTSQVSHQRDQDPQEQQRERHANQQGRHVVGHVAADGLRRATHQDQHEPRRRQPPLPAGDLEGSQRGVLGLHERDDERRGHSRRHRQVLDGRPATPTPGLAEHRSHHGDQQRDRPGRFDQRAEGERGRGPELPVSQQGHHGRSHSQPQQRVVVPSSNAVEHDHRVPADQDGGERGPLGQHPSSGHRYQEDRSQAGRGGQELEGQDDAGRRLDDASHSARHRAERRPVNRRRVDPVHRHQGVGGVADELGGDVGVGVGRVVGHHPPIDRIAVHVPGQEQGDRHRHRVEDHGHDHDPSERHVSLPRLDQREQERSGRSEQRRRSQDGDRVSGQDVESQPLGQRHQRRESFRSRVQRRRERRAGSRRHEGNHGGRDQDCRRGQAGPTALPAHRGESTVYPFPGVRVAVGERTAAGGSMRTRPRTPLRRPGRSTRGAHPRTGRPARC
jgi:hypothetical protein